MSENVKIGKAVKRKGKKKLKGPLEQATMKSCPEDRPMEPSGQDLASELTGIAHLWEEIPSRTPSQSDDATDTEGVGKAKATSSPEIRRQIRTQTRHGDPFRGFDETAVYSKDDQDLIVEVVKDYNCALIFTVRTRYIFLVSKELVCLASAVIKNKRFERTGPGFFSKVDTRINNDGVTKLHDPDWIVHVEVDEYVHPSTLLLVLKILHWTTGNDMDLDFDTCIEIAAVCREYQVEKALWPWSQLWISKYAKEALDYGKEDWLFFTSVFDSDKEAENLVIRLSEECGPGSEPENQIWRYNIRDIQNQSSWIIGTDLWPRKIYERILKLRSKKVQHLHSALEELEALLVEVSNDTTEYCSSSACVSMAYGSLLLSVKRAGLGEFLTHGAKDWTSSVEQLRQQMQIVGFTLLSSVTITHTCKLDLVQRKFGMRLAGSTIRYDQAIDLGIEDRDPDFDGW